jgi:Ycf66 protein N-terminus
MLAYILAVSVGASSVGLYIAAFFFPELHRKQDFIWSGVGFFYALTLWIYAREVTGGILIGQTASVALLGWFAWQTFKLRRQLVPVDRQTPIPTATQIQERVGLNRTRNVSSSESKLGNTVKPGTKAAARSAPKPPAPTPPVVEIAQPQNRSEPESVNVPPRRQQPPAIIPDRSTTAKITSPETQQQPPVNIDRSDDEEEKAWIELKIKSSAPAAKPPRESIKPPTPEPLKEIIQPATPPPAPPKPIGAVPQSTALVVTQPLGEAIKPPSAPKISPIPTTPVDKSEDEENWG